MTTTSGRGEKTSLKSRHFTESVIREMTRIAAERKAVNLGQGIPDFACPEELKEAACAAIREDINQYAITWGDRLLREAIAEKSSSYLGMAVDPEKEVTVTCGSTEAMMVAMLSIVDPGDEVIIFEPFYENYGPDTILSGAVPRYVPLRPPDWTFDEAELVSAFNERTRAIIVNTPNNPTGKVFTIGELELIASLCQKWGAIAFTDEIYEHILYDGARHVAIGSLPGMKDLTVTMSGLSKTYTVTGWRLGHMIACPELTAAIRKVHDFLTVGAPAPLQRAAVTALRFGQSFYDQLAADYAHKRRLMLDVLADAQIPYHVPEGAYYVMSDISGYGFDSDVDFTRFLVEQVGVAVVPGSSFFKSREIGRRYVRFCFSRKDETMEAARTRLKTLDDQVRKARR